MPVELEWQPPFTVADNPTVVYAMNDGRYILADTYGTTNQEITTSGSGMTKQARPGDGTNTVILGGGSRWGGYTHPETVYDKPYGLKVRAPNNGRLVIWGINCRFTDWKAANPSTYTEDGAIVMRFLHVQGTKNHGNGTTDVHVQGCYVGGLAYEGINTDSGSTSTWNRLTVQDCHWYKTLGFTKTTGGHDGYDFLQTQGTPWTQYRLSRLYAPHLTYQWAMFEETSSQTQTVAVTARDIQTKPNAETVNVPSWASATSSTFGKVTYPWYAQSTAELVDGWTYDFANVYHVPRDTRTIGQSVRMGGNDGQTFTDGQGNYTLFHGATVREGIHPDGENVTLGTIGDPANRYTWTETAYKDVPDAHVLTISDLSHGQSIGWMRYTATYPPVYGGLVVTASNALTISDLSHAQSIWATGYQAGYAAVYGGLFTAQAAALVISPLVHGHGIESPTLTQHMVPELTISDLSHGHSIESPTLTQKASLTIADASHDHVVHVLGLDGTAVLTIKKLRHAHPVESPTLPQASVLVISDTAHGQTVEAPTVAQASVLVVSDATHAHPVESPSFAQVAVLVISDATHAHGVEAPTVGQRHALTTEALDHGQTVEALTVAQRHGLIVAELHHEHELDALLVTQLGSLSIADLVHAQDVAAVVVAQTHDLTVSDLTHGQTVPALVLGAFVTPTHRRLIVLPESRTFIVRPDPTA